MLQRVEEADQHDDEDEEILDSDDDSNESADLAERLHDIDLNDADAIWERLTDEEKQEFKSIVHNGDIDKIVQSVELWWKQKLEIKLVRDVNDDAVKLQNILKSCPKILKDIKDFGKISTKKPAQCIIYNIANVIGVYSYIYRLYNGDQLSYEQEAVNNFITICDNLKQNQNFEDIAAVADAIMLSCHNAELFADLSTKQMILDDVKDIFDGPVEESEKSFILAALSDTINMFKQAKAKYRKEQHQEAASKGGKFSAEFVASEGKVSYKELENQAHFTGCLKKLEFYLSFINSRYNVQEWQINWSQ